MRSAGWSDTRRLAGRADLVRMLDVLDDATMVRVASMLGYEHNAAVAAAEPTDSVADTSEPMRPPPTTTTVEPMAPVPIWIPTHYEPHPATAVVSDEGPGLTEADLMSPGASLLRTPAAPPLAPWSTLWPRLQRALRTARLGSEPDVPRLIRALVNGMVLRRIPRRERRSWPSRVAIWLDGAQRLVPFDGDQLAVLRRLRRALPAGTLDERWLTVEQQASSMQARGDLLDGVRPEPGVPVLVLGDLGAYATAAIRTAWMRTARRLAWQGHALRALVPVPPGRWDRTVARAWHAMTWERPVGASPTPAAWSQRAERLLCVASAAAYLQPGLLRALRRLLPATSVDAAAEADAWNHRDVLVADAAGMVLRPEAAKRWREQFVESIEIDAGLRRKVFETVRRWHESLPRELLHAETLAWEATVGDDAVAPDALRAAMQFGAKVARSALDASSVQGAARHYGKVVTPALPAHAFEAPAVGRLLVRLWARSFHGDGEVAVPQGIDPQELLQELAQLGPGPPSPEPSTWTIRQVGSSLVFSSGPRARPWPSHDGGPGGPVAWLRASRADLLVSRRRGDGPWARVATELHDGLVVELRAGECLRFDVDRSLLELLVEPEPMDWAVAYGRDRYGLWADADILGVVQRFRYIPPGTVRLGSPDSEEGRWDDEGPTHDVTWTRGYWLADTPVTQALWAAVMGANPSEFKSPTRPVENVSADDCDAFIATLAERAPGLLPRLPTEVEWEYACRAGTETATWRGDLQIEGDNNAPILDAIAWYGGNSGHAYDLAEGHDSSGWKDKQYPHTTAGTRLVTTRGANPFGLFDMLGNVWEWCADSSLPYEGGDRKDPPARMKAGASRVLRGGSWHVHARGVRAAARAVGQPGYRDSFYGFRLARAPSPGPAQGMESPAEPPATPVVGEEQLRRAWTSDDDEIRAALARGDSRLASALDILRHARRDAHVRVQLHVD